MDSKKTLFRVFLISMAVELAGCGNHTTVHSESYYMQHLAEANKVVNRCIKSGYSTHAQHENCINAGSAQNREWSIKHPDLLLWEKQHNM
ncbi:EexN family lipoprotein [Acidithiobacillus caldus]|uniref:EexN family lipoprotein n=1 Tax=Acidithiobacillus caldus TaxID=33059 RepID=UPI001C07E36B|nr:EexN family lipoprotein [Acidithiobacillus caldus]MBU2770127.1 EexN family lipoprotein [Acidithiobacillus caldus]